MAQAPQNVRNTCSNLTACFRAPETALETVLGVVVRSDYRRLEELYDLIDDEGYDALLLSAVITALSTSVI